MREREGRLQRAGRQWLVRTNAVSSNAFRIDCCSLYAQPSAVSAAGRELLSEDDALRVYEEIERAKNRAFYVGQYLGLHVADVESICTQEKEARDQLYKVLLQTAREAKLTWERVAVALRQPLVALPLVAQRIEETHCRGSSVPTLPRTAPEQSTEVIC